MGQDFCTRPPSLLLSPARLRNIGDGNRNSPIGPQGSESTPMGGLGDRSSPYASPRRPLTRGGGRGGQSHYSTLDLGFQTSTPAGKNYSSNQGGPRPPLPCRLRRPPPPLRCSSLDRAHYSAPSNNCLVTQRLAPAEAPKAPLTKMTSETAPLPSPEDPRTPTNPPLPPLPTDSGSCGSSSSSGYSSQAGGGVPQTSRPQQEDATPHSSMELLPMHPMPIPMPITLISSLHTSMPSNSPLDQLPPPPPAFDPNPLYGNLQ